MPELIAQTKDLKQFVNQYVIRRNQSLFAEDIDTHRDELNERIIGKSILVIGGAGTIGSSFIRTVLPFRPSELVVVDTNENGLTELTRSLRSDKDIAPLLPLEYMTYPMDYGTAVFRRMFGRHERRAGLGRGFDIVANFSAHKHVRSEKDIFSIEALIRNNVINAKTLLDMLATDPPESFFCVSTDKAANPVNIMGASKRIMEDLIFSYSDSFPVKTARFANVAFSNGSLPDGFLERIQQSQPLSAPSDVKRYFVSTEESGQICMLSAILGDNREIMFPKLDEAQMTTFDRIAEDLIHFLGQEVEYCYSEQEAIEKAAEWKRGKAYPIFISPSDTSGEKSFEEFYAKGETVDLDRFQSLGVVIGKDLPDRSRIDRFVKKLEQMFDSQECKKEDVVDLIKDYLPNFDHIETGKNLDEKM